MFALLLSFRLHQIFLGTPNRYFLPVPKLSTSQVAKLSEHLTGRGLRVADLGASKLRAQSGGTRVSIDGKLGLASSNDDMLDLLGPSIPVLLSAKTGRPTDRSTLYFAVKRLGGLSVVHLFPRLESLSTWTCLRREGLCGLTPDEAEAVRRLLKSVPESSQVDCVTASPTTGSRPLQMGRKVYHRSRLPAPEFLSRLRTMESGTADSAAYLPRDSVLKLDGQVDSVLSSAELGEWCLA